MRWRLEFIVCFAYGLINKSYSDEYTATEKWRLCWGVWLPSGFSLLFAFVVLYVYILCNIFLCKFGMTVLFVMYELLVCLVVSCEMSTIPELECTYDRRMA